MKFEYENIDDGRDCVAYVDKDGDIIMKDEAGNTNIVVFGSEGACTYRYAEFTPSEAVHKFYIGDKVKITF